MIFEALTDKTDGEVLRLSDLPRRVLQRSDAAGGLVSARAVRARVQAGPFDLVAELEALERAAVAAALELEGGNAAAAARRLGRIGRGASRDPGQTLRAMAKRLGLDRPEAARPSPAADRTPSSGSAARARGARAVRPVIG